ncbi:MAG: hypothetical protein HC884_05220 [Chloroflexaceae bacterium]|nr:hypothetical protein [Chloroflexaceae bacterium]
MAYVADYDDGLSIIDVSNPATAAEVGSFDTPGYAREVQIVGNLAYVADGTGGLQILRVSGNEPPPPPPTIHTLLLTNRQRLASLSSEAEATSVLAKLNDLAAHERVKGKVIQVEEDGAVAAAYAAWSNPDSAPQANAVADAIKQVIEGELDANPEVRYVVIVGDDRVLPFRRTNDLTRVPDPHTLTDDFYTDRVPTSNRGHDLYIPDLAGGRLLETPAQIIAQIDTFLANDGIALNTGVVAGYDFVKDGAQAHCTAMKADNLTADCSLIHESWGAGDFRSLVLGTSRSLVSINAHANPFGFGTPNGFVSAGDFRDSAADFARAVFYTVGCHSGENVIGSLDLPEAIAGEENATYIANTGYGWGGWGVILSEELMLRFTEHLLAGGESTPGQALMLAKQHYFAEHPDPDGYDEKIGTESTLYGLPMYHATSPGAMLAEQPSGVTTSKTSVRLSDALHQTSYQHDLRIPQPIDTEVGRYYVLPDGLTSSTPGTPVQPAFATDVAGAAPGAVHGVLFTGGTYGLETVDPVIQQVYTTTNRLTAEEQPFAASDWYPLIPLRLNRVALADATLETVVTMVGQHNPNLATDNQRVFLKVAYDTFSSASDDWTAPTGSLTASTLDGTTAQMTVNASDPSGIHTVVVAYTDTTGAWLSQELTAGSGNTWSGSFDATAATEFFVQIVDGAGNAAVLVGQEEQYFAFEPQPEPQPDTPPVISAIADQEVAMNGITPAIPFTVQDDETDVAALTVTVHSDNPSLVPTSNIVLSGTGITRTVTIAPAPDLSGTATISLTVRDTGGNTASTAFVLTVTEEHDTPINLFAYDHEIWTAPAILRVGEAGNLGVLVHGQGIKNPLEDIPVRFMRDDPQTGVLLGSSAVPFLDHPQDVDSTRDLAVTFDTAGVYTVFALIDPYKTIETDDTTRSDNVVQRTVVVLPPSPDQKPPVITSFRINEGADETSDPAVNLTIHALDQQPDPGEVAGVAFIEYEYKPVLARWTPVKVSDAWHPFPTTPSTYPWNLLPSAGMRYLYARAIDDTGNISGPARALINYEPGRTSVSQGETRIYRYQVADGQQVTVDLEVVSGDADLYVWSSDTSASPWVSNLPAGDEQVLIPAGEVVPGVYQVEVFGFTDAEYRLQFHATPTPAASSTLQATGGVDPDKTVPAAPVVPVASVPEADLPDGSAPPLPEPPEDQDEPEPDTRSLTYLPLVVR